jgi:ribonuclease HI
MASIFCDGACPGNGKKSAYGGWAWAYWPGPAIGEPANYGAGKLRGDATNQRAELTALLEAILWARSAFPGRPIHIYSDSQYSINCTSVWGPGWKRKGWKRATGGPIQNLDLIQQLVEVWTPLLPLHHVRGHQTGFGPEAHGNNWVDRAAVAAANGQPVSKVLVLDIPVSPMETIEHVDSGPGAGPKPIYAARDIRNWFS